MIRRLQRLVWGRTLLQKFGLISLVAISLMGAGLGELLRSSVERQVLDGAIAEAGVVNRLGLQSAIGPSELKSGLSADRVQALQLSLRADFARIDVVDVVLWNLDGTVIFATDTADVGQTFAPTPDVARAAAGEPIARITDTSGEDAEPSRRRHGLLLDVYQPVRFGSIGNDETSGVLRTSIPYGPVADTIATETRRLYLALAVALVTLYLVLYRLVANASSELQRRADQNERQARHDALTALPNRTLFAERLQRILEVDPDEPLTVAVIDLDRFKEVNDTLGHHHGDLLLIEVGQRLRATVRPNDVVARLGGDEFSLILPGVGDPESALRAAQRVVSGLGAPFEIEGLTLDVGASVGLAIKPDHGADLSTLLQRADIAMYEAKRSGGGCVVFDPAFDTNSREQLAMAGDLRRSMATELVVHYQPKIDLTTGQLCGVEALVRWEHPELGLVSPDVFIPLAERGGMMNALTAIVLDHSLAQLRRWLDCGFHLHVAVNVSARGLHDVALVDMVVGALDCHGVGAEHLVLEITETMITADPDAARVTMGHLQRAGVRFSIDDFGTGYSSLAVLRTLPVDELKIDRQFIKDLDRTEGAAIVEYSTKLGHMLGLTVLAEGVERAEDADRLRQLGCDMVQGFGFARPMPADEVTLWMTDRAAAGPGLRDQSFRTGR